MNEICNKKPVNISCKVVDEVIEGYANILQEVAVPLLSVTKKPKKVDNIKKVQEWVCEDSKKLRKVFFRNVQALKKLVINSDNNRTDMIKSRANYSKHVRNCRRMF